MNLIKYDCTWVGIDSGREGLWKEPIWRDVLRIIAAHSGERVYDASSPIYQSLEQAHPNEAWRSTTSNGKFRPLFRDYPNPWTRTKVVSLTEQRFQVTEIGKQVLTGIVGKSDLLVDMFKYHHEQSGAEGAIERPFAILASGLLATPKPLSTQEVFWVIMKNYRPGHNSLPEELKRAQRLTAGAPAQTPYRRLRNMLALMRTAQAISSTRRGPLTIWSALNRELLNEIQFETK